MDMDLAQLKAVLAADNILVVEVEDLGEMEKEGFRVSGGLREYVGALKALGIEILFVYVEVLEEEDFLQTIDEEADDYRDFEEADLRAECPELKGYEGKIGEAGRLLLYAGSPSIALTYEIENEWYGEFLEELDRACGSLERKRGESRKERELSYKKRMSEIDSKLHALIEDDAFVQLRTQKAMLAYAREHVGGLEDCEPESLKVAIADLVAVMQARGIRE